MCKLEIILQFWPHKTGHLLCSVVVICFQIKYFKLGYLCVTSLFKIFLLFFILGIL